ncbi:hypothetical protein FS837_002579, partial [Tulasnella sp. UAMH 9824]
MSTIQRLALFLTRAAVLLALGTSESSAPGLVYMHFVANTPADNPFLPTWAAILLVLIRSLSLIARYNVGETRRPYVILILVHYKDWKDRSEGGRSMQLDSVKGDLKRLLDYLKYRHGDTTRTWYILSDFEYMYEDYTGTVQAVTRCGLPDRETILKTIEEATKNGGSGLIHYGGHCHYAVPGTSSLEKRGSLNIYTETNDYQQGRKAAYLVCGDGKRIYGIELFARLPYSSNTGTVSTTTLVLDTCHAEGFTGEELPSGSDPEYMPFVNPTLIPHVMLLHQLIVVTASRLHEKALSVNGCGALTFFMIKYLD